MSRTRYLVMAGLWLVTTGCGGHPARDTLPAVETGTADEHEEIPTQDDAMQDDTALEEHITTESPAETLLEQLMSGEAQAAAVLQQVALGEGWPLKTADGFLFLCLDTGTGPYRLAGAHNEWDPEPLQKAGNFHWAVVSIPEPHGKLYKFVDAADSYFADPYARHYGYDQYGEYSLVRPEGAHLQRWPYVGNTEVEPRALRVWIPEEPVTHRLYVHDGQNLFSPTAPHGGWKLHDAVGKSTMIVGIDNTPARMHEYTHTQDFINEAWVGGGSKEYCEFIQETVRPWVNATFGQVDTEGILGSSLGGLVSLACVLKHGLDFNFVGSLSGTVGWGSINANHQTLIHLVAQQDPIASIFYLDSGGNAPDGCEDLDDDGIEDDRSFWDNYCTTRQMADVMAEAGYVWQQTLWHWWEPDAAHNEAAWANRVWRPLQIFEGL